MTGDERPAFYPQYCFHLSPTINHWCPLRAADIHALHAHPGFAGQDVYFYLNHPVRWVRIVGVVVAVDEYRGRRNYTVDDSTGACIECTIEVPKTTKPALAWGGKAAAPAAQVQAVARTASAATGNDASGERPPSVPEDLDVGMVVDVKGSVRVFRDQKQIKIQKASLVRFTEDEVRFWNKIASFRREVLDQPWLVDRRELRRLRKQHIADMEAEDRRGKKRREQQDRQGPGQGVTRKVSHRPRSGRTDGPSRPATTDLVRRHRQAVAAGEETHTAKGNYNALGL